ncbi:MAG: hypothetical protein GXP14_07415 [Gammaproteobacteria bacterium]|nr:hypothetical protein [Gammaproteobacteria bacterium]
MKMINFDVAQALVNYVARDGDCDSLAWGILTAKTVREELCRVRGKDNKVCFQLLCNYFAENRTGKMVGNANKKLEFLKILMKEASNTK